MPGSEHHSGAIMEAGNQNANDDDDDEDYQCYVLCSFQTHLSFMIPSKILPLFPRYVSISLAF